MRPQENQKTANLSAPGLDPPGRHSPVAVSLALNSAGISAVMAALCFERIRLHERKKRPDDGRFWGRRLGWALSKNRDGSWKSTDGGAGCAAEGPKR